MKINYFKIRRRITPILSAAFLNFVPILFQAVFSYYIIQKSSAELWGNFVQILIWINLLAQVLNWGTRDYLLRAFSKKPANFLRVWKKAFRERIWILLFTLPFLFFFENTLILFIWLLFLFINRSFDVLFIFKNRFSTQLLRDALVYSLVFILFTLAETITLQKVLLMLSAIAILQSVFNLIYFRIKENVFLSFIPSGFEIVRDAFPFFLISLSGMLQSRVEIYMVSFLEQANTLAVYQVFSNFMVLWLGILYMVLVPYQKQIYRLNSVGLKKVQIKFSLFGTFTTIIFFVIIHFILSNFYGFTYSGYFWLLAFFSILPIFFSYIEVQKIYRFGAERFLVLTSFFLTIMEATLNYIFIPIFSLEGVITIKFFTATFLLIAYSVKTKKLALLNKKILTS